MHVHHLNCGCMCPLGGALFDGYSRGLTASVPCHCLLIETDHSGLVLVDTGFGQGDVQHPERLSLFFRVLNNIRLEHRFTALDQVRRLGFSPDDVRHILLTHLDFDHAGGLQDFPKARVHVMAAEREQAFGAVGWKGRRRFRAPQWRGVEDWQLYGPEGEAWFGFDSVRAVLGAEREDILLVPLRGHTEGHAGVAVRTPEGWKLHAGDAYFHHDEVHLSQRQCPPGMRLYQRMMDTDRQARLHNQQRLRALALGQAGHVEIFCSHDPAEMLQARSVVP
ncbi:MBL fold metallo-hydrolase [Pseudomonas capeferrum]|uniref:MBL fold metallo-hydrolase n=1 Tax=Pseudomonas capeferrum TaxID=1495066 RepID=UPI0015E2F9D1|nr:MBL fold metallo-hydrolase [Pseudomonas capeferrum]MBA1203808.1 MBL fold metallo-hydrolase [Pseudomonas capeferrum]